MKIKEWVVQTGNGSYIALDLRNKLIFTKKVQKALLLDTKKEAMRYINKYTPWKPKRLTFELVDKPTNKPYICKWVIQITGATKFSKQYRNRYVAQKARAYNNIAFVKTIDKATVFDNKNGTISFFCPDSLRWRVKKLIFELVG
jgi:hypothetical protein